MNPKDGISPWAIWMNLYFLNSGECSPKTSRIDSRIRCVRFSIDASSLGVTLGSMAFNSSTRRFSFSMHRSISSDVNSLETTGGGSGAFFPDINYFPSLKENGEHNPEHN